MPLEMTEAIQDRKIRFLLARAGRILLARRYGFQVTGKSEMIEVFKAARHSKNQKQVPLKDTDLYLGADLVA